MALIECKECGADVSNKAKACPRCGAQVARKEFGCGSLLMVIFVIVLVFNLLDDDKAAGDGDVVAEQPTEKKCESDSCLADKYMVDAVVACKRPIQNLSKYQFEWLDGWSVPMFSKYRVSRDDGVVIMYFGDALKFQNGFGSWSNILYMCQYDTARDAVVDYMAEDGRL